MSTIKVAPGITVDTDELLKYNVAMIVKALVEIIDRISNLYQQAPYAPFVLSHEQLRQYLSPEAMSLFDKLLQVIDMDKLQAIFDKTIDPNGEYHTTMSDLINILRNGPPTTYGYNQLPPFGQRVPSPYINRPTAAMLQIVAQVCGCTIESQNEDGVNAFVSDAEAQFYGVYLGTPGAFVHQCDKNTKEEALAEAKKLVAEGKAATIDDKTYS